MTDTMIAAIFMAIINFSMAAFIIVVGIFRLLGISRNYSPPSPSRRYRSTEEIEEDERQYARTHNLDAVNEFLGWFMIFSSLLLVVPALLELLGVVYIAVTIVFLILYFVAVAVMSIYTDTSRRLR